MVKTDFPSSRVLQHRYLMDRYSMLTHLPEASPLHTFHYSASEDATMPLKHRVTSCVLTSVCCSKIFQAEYLILTAITVRLQRRLIHTVDLLYRRYSCYLHSPMACLTINISAAVPVKGCVNVLQPGRTFGP